MDFREANVNSTTGEPRPRSESVLPTNRGARLLAVGGGKGGVGKTFVTVNLATSLARLGKRVVVVDVDLEGANLHTCLGVQTPQRSLADFVSEREEDLGKLVIDTPIPNLRLIGATHGNLADAQPSHLRRVRLLRGLRQLDADIVMLDLGAGSHASVLDYFLVSDDGILVLQPEPTSVENAYTFLRAAFYRRMRLAMVGHGVRQLVTLAMDQRNERGIRTPLDLLREIEAMDTEEARRFVETMRVFRPRVIVNGVRTAEDVKLGFAVSSVCKKYFGVEAEYLGYVNYDDEARRSVSMRRPIVDLRPDADVSIYLQRIARKLLGLPSASVAAHTESAARVEGRSNSRGGHR
ncbi:MAG: ATP-binding protein [Deltaproteobacteria bacterium]|nr:ATP-binding protein [Deltaproteobacteria bacterium]